MPALAQSPSGRWFPSARHFPPLLADPTEPRYSAALIATDLFARTAAPAERPAFQLGEPGANLDADLQGAVGIGTSVPVFELARWPGGGATLGALVGVFARFRVEQSSRDEVANDWYVGVPLALAHGPLGARLRLVHRSSHMGDELQAQGAARTEFSYEAVDLLAAYRPAGSVRVYGGGAVNLRTNSYILEERDGQLIRFSYHDRLSVQAGTELSWKRWAAGAAALLAGVDLQASDRTDWQPQLSAILGLGGRLGGRVARLLARCYDGPSMIGEFFRTDERYCGIEAALEL